MGAVKEKYINNIDASTDFFEKKLDLASYPIKMKIKGEKLMSKRDKINKIIRILIQNRENVYSDSTLDAVISIITKQEHYNDN